MVELDFAMFCAEKCWLPWQRVNDYMEFRILKS